MLTSRTTIHFARRTFSSVHDVAIVGGGIIGCATARELAIRHPELNIVVLEKEQAPGKTKISKWF